MKDIFLLLLSLTKIVVRVTGNADPPQQCKLEIDLTFVHPICVIWPPAHVVSFLYLPLPMILNVSLYLHWPNSVVEWEACCFWQSHQWHGCVEKS
jgi:hypothetical protein